MVSEYSLRIALHKIDPVQGTHSAYGRAKYCTNILIVHTLSAALTAYLPLKVVPWTLIIGRLSNPIQAVPTYKPQDSLQTNILSTN